MISQETDFVSGNELQIVNVCKGFPLALTVVGRSLCGQPEAIWQDRVRKWSKGGSIFESNIDLRDCLKTSLDVLNHKLKECYMDLIAFPEGQLIPASAIIDMWEELYELNGDGFTSIANLHELSALNLINPVPTRYACGICTFIARNRIDHGHSFMCSENLNICAQFCLFDTHQERCKRS